MTIEQLAADPDVRAQLARVTRLTPKVSRIYYGKEACRPTNSEAAKLRWKNPAYRAKMKKARRKPGNSF